MPQYELMLLVKKLPQNELKECLKRAANFILDSNGVLRKIENLGLQPLHRKLGNAIPNSRRFSEANFFVYHLDLSPDTMRKVYQDCRMDNDLMRTFYVRKETNIPEGYRCTLDEEMKPPSIRKSVQSLIKQGRRKTPTYDMGPPSVRQIV